MSVLALCESGAHRKRRSTRCYEAQKRILSDGDVDAFTLLAELVAAKALARVLASASPQRREKRRENVCLARRLTF
jgi:hypothetical protein